MYPPFHSVNTGIKKKKTKNKKKTIPLLNSLGVLQIYTFYTIFVLNLKAVLIMNSLKARSTFLSIDSQLIELKLLKLWDLGSSNLNMIEKFEILQNSCEIVKFLFQHG